jgi:hypothetical protein
VRSTSSLFYNHHRRRTSNHRSTHSEGATSHSTLPSQKSPNLTTPRLQSHHHAPSSIQPCRIPGRPLQNNYHRRRARHLRCMLPQLLLIWSISCRHQVLNRHAARNLHYQVGLSEDKGTRRSMEDAHSFVVDFGGIRGQGFFAVFDGHAGKHAAEWCGGHFHEVCLLRSSVL